MDWLFGWLFPDGITAQEKMMLVVGLGGQALFSARFLIQWVKSEMSGESVNPLAFWYFSLAGGITLFVYAFSRKDPVIMLGQGAGIFIYARNLYLIYRSRRRLADANNEPQPDPAPPGQPNG